MLQIGFANLNNSGRCIKSQNNIQAIFFSLMRENKLAHSITTEI